MIQESSQTPAPALPEVPVDVAREAARDYFPGLDPTRLKWLAALVGLLLALWIGRKVVRFIRKRRPPRLHPKLQRYGEGATSPEAEADFAARRHAEAAKIVATSSTSEITGYEILEQIEAVYVDGFRKPEDALEGLKAVAAMKGANAVIRVRHERNAAGRCSASGDAVVVRKYVIARHTPGEAPHAGGPERTA